MKKNLHLLLVSTFMLISFFSTAQISKLANNNSILAGMTIGSKAVLVDIKDSLWVTDGTSAGTKKFTQKVALDSSMNVAYYKGKIYFAGVNATRGSELWVTDGTSTGTNLVKDISPNSDSSSPENFYVFNNTLYFFAETSANGKELWKSDGTAGGTTMVKDIRPGPKSSFVESGYFYANNNILYFIANDGTHGDEPWKTNGTSQGTVLLKDINPNGSSKATGFTAFGTLVMFSADNGTAGQELWKTNGTTTGTALVKDIATGFPKLGSSPSQFFPFNNKLYFGALDLTNGYELWVTNGTTTGTTLVSDINPGSNSSIPILTNAIVFNNKFYFTATNAANGTELFSSNGTTPGTKLFKDLRPGATSSSPFIWVNFFGGSNSGGPHYSLYNGKIFLQATDSHGTELWITNGISANTKMVKDIRPGAASSMGAGSSILSYFYTTSSLYFTANDGSTGVELWKSNGTGTGTKLVKDINPGSANSSPRFLYVLLNNQLLFTADDGDNAFGKTDLYKISNVDTLAFASASTEAVIAPDGRSFYIYPNPVRNTLSVVINNSSSKQAAIAITDQNGRQLYIQQLNSGLGTSQYNLDIHSYANGLYYLQLITDKGIATKKFIKN